MEAGHLQECNKQLFEDQLRRIIVEAKAKVLKAKSHPGAESTGERALLETQISSEGISVGLSSQQVMSAGFFRWLDCQRLKCMPLRGVSSPKHVTQLGPSSYVSISIYSISIEFCFTLFFWHHQRFRGRSCNKASQSKLCSIGKLQPLCLLNESTKRAWT